jgi:hypothetical protein
MPRTQKRSLESKASTPVRTPSNSEKVGIDAYSKNNYKEGE